MSKDWEDLVGAAFLAAFALFAFLFVYFFVSISVNYLFVA